MKLAQANVARLKLPEGKSDHLEFDDEIPGFGLRLRAGGKRTWLIQYRVGAKQRRHWWTTSHMPTAAATKASHALRSVIEGNQEQPAFPIKNPDSWSYSTGPPHWLS
jgi:hypothetical protein